MPVILRALPFFAVPSAVTAGTDVVAVRPYQIVIWVSVAAQKLPGLPPNARRFPAVLDIGHSHNFSIRDHHLRAWAGVATESLSVLRQARVNRVTVPLYGADVWIHPNDPDDRDRATAARPYRLDLSGGIAVYPPDTLGEPRLPLLGLRALVLNDLHLTIDGRRRRVALRTTRRFWPF